MWRPDGWENPYLKNKSCWKVSGSYVIPTDIYEAGADAILEILRDSGIRTNSFRTNSSPIYLTNPRQNGVYVFIPEK